MADLWSLGGLSARELLKRTARESWRDDVFGQAARLAFYHFLAIFPVLFLLLIALARLPWAGAEMRNALAGSVRQFLPGDAAQLVAGAIRDLDASARAGGLLLVLAAAGAMWAGVNSSWAMIVGLNTAYEAQEDRGWREIAVAAVGLAFAVVALVFAALFATEFLGHTVAHGHTLSRLAEWAATVIILMVSFALFYRFGPNLKDREWQWSTPGAVFAGVLWVASTLLVRTYFDRIATYQTIYGRVEPAAILLIWLYITSATVLIGAELNSEIEKAAGHRRSIAPRTQKPDGSAG